LKHSNGCNISFLGSLVLWWPNLYFPV